VDIISSIEPLTNTVAGRAGTSRAGALRPGRVELSDPAGNRDIRTTSAVPAILPALPSSRSRGRAAGRQARPCGAHETPARRPGCCATTARCGTL